MAGFEIDVEGFGQGIYVAVDARVEPVLGFDDVGIEGEGLLGIVPSGFDVGVAEGAAVVADGVDVQVGAREHGVF